MSVRHEEEFFFSNSYSHVTQECPADIYLHQNVVIAGTCLLWMIYGV